MSRKEIVREFVQKFMMDEGVSLIGADALLHTDVEAAYTKLSKTLSNEQKDLLLDLDSKMNKLNTREFELYFTSGFEHGITFPKDLLTAKE
ncbi:MAG: hypothetical protein WCQ41_04105 [Bacillota bacterium]